MPGRRRTSRASTSPGAPMQSTPPQLIQAKNAYTPGRGPTRKPAVISLEQKQALIDNLQLEITERARKLRAQYALQAQGLRTRLEIRVGRIPAALRKASLGELLEKHALQAMKEKETTIAGAAQKVLSPKSNNTRPATRILKVAKPRATQVKGGRTLRKRP